MALIGDFTPTETTDPDADPDEFQYFGEVFAIPAHVGAGALLKFTWLIKQSEGLNKRGQSANRRALTEDAKVRANADLVDAELTAMSAMYELLTACLGSDQVDDFLKIADRNGVTNDGLMDVCDRIQEVIAGRPTRRSADSSDGPSKTGTPSTAGGSGPTAPAPPAAPALTDRERQIAEMDGYLTSVGV